MKRLLSFLFKDLEAKSVVDVLPSYFSKKRLQKLAESGCDPRELSDQALKMLNWLPEKFFKKLSNRIRFPLYLNPTLEFPLGLMAQLPLGRLERLGAFPIIRGNQVCAIWAVDPLVAKNCLGIFDNFPIYLGRWSEISSAWKFYESRLIEKEKVEHKLQQVFEKLMLRIAEELSNSNLENLQLDESLIADFLEPADLDALGVTSSYFWERLKELTRRGDVSISFILDQVGYVNLAYSFDCEKQLLKIKSHSIKKSAIDPPAESLLNDSAPKGLSNVLLIDDSSIFTTVLKKYLANSQFQFKDFVIPRAAINYLRRTKKPIDLIVCDLHMPDLNGEDVLNSVRQIDRYRATPFVFLTSEKNVDQKIQLFQKGVDAYIGKDEDPRLIAVQLQSLINKKNQSLILDSKNV